jgi:predicted transcriptional regulator
MGITKTNLFSDVQNDVAASAKGFAHPARVAIILHLLKVNTCINGDLVQELGLAQATISQHLRELKDLGIIQGTVEGTRMCYCLDPERWAEIKAQFDTIFNHFGAPRGGDCC